VISSVPKTYWLRFIKRLLSGYLLDAVERNLGRGSQRNLRTHRRVM